MPINISAPIRTGIVTPFPVAASARMPPDRASGRDNRIVSGWNGLPKSTSRIANTAASPSSAARKKLEKKSCIDSVSPAGCRLTPSGKGFSSIHAMTADSAVPDEMEPFRSAVMSTRRNPSRRRISAGPEPATISAIAASGTTFPSAVRSGMPSISAMSPSSAASA
ncbi:hypothetical protein D9M72_555050 [compost metagenome]